MSGARLLAGNRITAKAYSYTDTVSRNIVNTQWTREDNWDLIYRVPVMGASPYYVQPLNFTLDGVTTSEYSGDVRWDVEVYDNSNALVWSSGTYNLLDDTLTSSTLSSVLYDDTDIAYRVQFRIYLSSGRQISTNYLNDFTADIECNYDDMQEPAPPPFELPDDWVENTTNTAADKFVPFTTVTTPIDSDNVDDSIDDFKDFLEGVNEHETLATVFMGYVSELLRLKGITAFLCFAICCITMITVFELSGGD